jgi:hypothetical protein
MSILRITSSRGSDLMEAAIASNIKLRGGGAGAKALDEVPELPGKADSGRMSFFAATFVGIQAPTVKEMEAEDQEAEIQAEIEQEAANVERFGDNEADILDLISSIDPRDDESSLFVLKAILESETWDENTVRY